MKEKLMNIVEAMTEFNKQNIILFSGLFGTHKTSIGKFFAGLFNFELVNLSDFFYPVGVFDKSDNYITLSDGSKILPWDDIYKSVDWDKFNKRINELAPTGVIAVGMGFPTSKITFKPDFHIHFKIGKEKVLENINAYLEKHQNEIEHPVETNTLIFNRVTFPVYLRARNEGGQINRYVNVADVTFEALKDDLHKYLMHLVDDWHKKHEQAKNNASEDDKQPKNMLKRSVAKKTRKRKKPKMSE